MRPEDGAGLPGGPPGYQGIGSGRRSCRGPTGYECTYENLIDTNSCSDSGVLAPLVGMISSMMAMECINIITGNKSSFDKKLFIVNGLNLSVDIIKTSNNPGCEVCE